jgi:hypothetical protein
MKKLLFIAALFICLSSCKKDNNNAAGNWYFESVNYGATSAVYSTADYSLTATSGGNTNVGSTLAFYFPATPTISGTYHVVNYTDTLGANQLYIRFINNTSSFYYFSTGNDNLNAKVTVSAAGKISVTVKSVYLKSYSAAISDSSQLTAIITQQ